METTMGHPIWWHHHGTKISVIGRRRGVLTLAGSAAELKISSGRDFLWKVEWNIKLSYDSEVSGVVFFTSAQLENAFRINTSKNFFEDHILERFCSNESRGNVSAEQGHFIRYKDYLNIPGPGTNLDGDPNISIEVSEEIKTAVANFMRGKF